MRRWADEHSAPLNFDTLLEAKVLIERWRQEYNTVRPHSALGYRPPAPEAILPLSACSATLHKQTAAELAAQPSVLPVREHELELLLRALARLPQPQQSHHQCVAVRDGLVVVVHVRGLG